jgi:hypothetical protein
MKKHSTPEGKTKIIPFPKPYQLPENPEWIPESPEWTLLPASKDVEPYRTLPRQLPLFPAFENEQGTWSLGDKYLSPKEWRKQQRE